MLSEGFTQPISDKEEIILPPLGTQAKPDIVETEPHHGIFSEDFMDFDRNLWMTLGDGDGYQEYYSRKNGVKRSIGWGQLKLLLTEIQFLTLYWDPILVPKPKVVYVGAADGTHIPILAELFPTITFHLYDPREFNKSVKDPSMATRIIIEEGSDPDNKGFFTDDECKKWENREDVFFICDIRAREYSVRDLAGKEERDAQNKENEKIVWENMEQQQNWVKIIKPVQAQLKFRLPYTYDFIMEEGPTRKYLDGIIYRQPWALPTSTETRLVVLKPIKGQYIIKDWDLIKYQEVCFYHNTQVREKFKFYNPYSPNEKKVAIKFGLSEDFDSIMTYQIIKDYLGRYYDKDDPKFAQYLLSDIFLKLGGPKNDIKTRRAKYAAFRKKEDQTEE